MAQTPASAIGIDIGGTRVKSVLIDSAGAVLAQDERDSAEGAPALVALIGAVLHTFGVVDRALPLGIACPGLARPDHRAIACMPGRLAGVAGLDFGQALGREVLVINDAHAATLSEAALGAAAGCRHVVMLTLGTGVGGGVILNGRLYTGATGRAGHLGHITVDAAGPRDICNMPGSIEDAIGNHSIKQRSGGRFTSTRDLLDAADAGDASAKTIWLDSVGRLAAAIASLINALDPEVVVIGGGIASAGAALFEPLDAAMQLTEWRPLGKAVPIVPAALGTLAGARGAALFALRPETDR